MPTLTALITSVRRRANLEQSSYITDSEQFITDAEITDYLNEGGAELHETLALTSEDYSISTSLHTIAANASSFSVPADFFHLRGVDRQDGDGYVALRPFTLEQRNDFRSPTLFYPTATIRPIGAWYNLEGSTLYIEPATQAPGTYRLWYTPLYTNLVSGSDTLSQPENWANYVVLYAAIQCRIKENIGSTVELQQQLERMHGRIIAAASRRGQPRVTKRIRTANIRYPR